MLLLKHLWSQQGFYRKKMFQVSQHQWIARLSLRGWNIKMSCNVETIQFHFYGQGGEQSNLKMSLISPLLTLTHLISNTKWKGMTRLKCTWHFKVFPATSFTRAYLFKKDDFIKLVSCCSRISIWLFGFGFHHFTFTLLFHITHTTLHFTSAVIKSAI